MRSNKLLAMLGNGKNAGVFYLENAIVGDKTVVSINKNSVTIADLKDLTK